MLPFAYLQLAKRGLVNLQSLCKLFPCHAVKQSVLLDLLTQGLCRKKVLPHIPKEINNLESWDVLHDKHMYQEALTIQRPTLTFLARIGCCV